MIEIPPESPTTESENKMSYAKRVTIGVLAGVVYEVMLLLVAVTQSASGHGSFLPLFAMWSPIGIGLAIWPIVGGCVAACNRKPAAIAGVALIANYFGIWYQLNQDSLSLIRQLRKLDAIGVCWIVIHLSLQAVLWWMIKHACQVRHSRRFHRRSTT